MKIYLSIGLYIFLWCVPTLAMAEVNIIGGTQAPHYTCTDDVGKKPTCKCSGFVDCRRLRDSGKCNEPAGDAVIVDMYCDLKGINCECNWTEKQSTVPQPSFKAPPSQRVAPRPSAPAPSQRYQYRQPRVYRRGIDPLPPAVSPDPEPPAEPVIR